MTYQNQIDVPHIHFDAQELKRHMALASKVRPKRSSLPVLSMAKIVASKERGRVKITTTDLDMQLSTELPAEVTRDLRCAAPVAAIESMVASAKDGIGFSVADDVLTMTSDDMTARLRLVIPVNDFPSIDAQHRPTPDEYLLRGSEAVMHRLLHLGRHCISTEETRYYLNGTFLTTHPERGTLRAVSTDGHRMGVIDSDIPADGLRGYILPRTSLSVLMSIIKSGGNREVKITLGENMLKFDLGDTVFHAKPIHGTFPDYNRVIPTEFEDSRFTLSRRTVQRLHAMQQAMDRDYQPAPTKLDAKDSTISVKIGDDVLTAPLQASGENSIGFNTRYLAQQMAISNPARISVSSKDNPAIIKGEDPEAFWILMPMRL